MSSNRSRYILSDAVKAEFQSWWHGLMSDTASGTARADRAVLRRADTLTAVAFAPAYQRVYRKLLAANGGAPWQPFEQDRIAALIGLAAHVKTDSPMSLPEAMSHFEENGERNPVSELRFTRILDAPDFDSLFISLRRSLPLINHKTNLAMLADDVFGWGDLVKKRWAYVYKWPQKASS